MLWFAVVVLLEQLTKAIFFIYFYIKIVSNGTVPVSLLSWKVTKNTVKDLLQDSWPLFLGGAVVMIQARIDQVLIKEMIGNAEVGQYSVAMSLIESFGFIPVVLQNSLFPSIQNAKAHSKKLYEDRLLNFYRLNFLLFLSVAIPIILFGEKIVVLLFGLEYQYAGALLPLMAIRLFFTNLTRFSLITLFVGTLTNIILNYLWIPLYEGTGAIGASLISFGVSIFLVDMFYLKTRKNVFLQMQGILTFYKISLRS